MKSDADVFGADTLNKLKTKKPVGLDDPNADPTADPNAVDAQATPSPAPAPSPVSTPTPAPTSSTQPLPKTATTPQTKSDADVFGADVMNQLAAKIPKPFNENEAGNAPSPLTAQDATAAPVPTATDVVGATPQTAANPNVKTGGYAAPAVLTDRNGAPPPGYDPTKWADKAHQSPKYSVGGIVADAIAKGARDMTPEILSKINEAYPGTQQVNGTTVNIPGIGEVQVINDGQVRWDPAGSFSGGAGGGAAGGNGVAPPPIMPPTGGGVGGVTPYVPKDFTTPTPQDTTQLGAPTANPVMRPDALGPPQSIGSQPDVVNALGAPIGAPTASPVMRPDTQNPIGPPASLKSQPDTPTAIGAPTSSPVTPTSPAQTASEAALLQILQGKTPDQIATDIGSDPAVSAHRTAARREFDRLRAQGAEGAAQSGTASSGGFEGQIRGLKQAEAEGNAVFTGSRVADAVRERNQQLIQGIQIATASGDADKARQLTLQMHDADLKQNGDQFLKQLGFNYDTLTAQQKQAAAALGQEDAHFGATLTQNQKQFMDNLGLNYAQLTAQQKQAIAQLAQQNDQFNKSLTVNDAQFAANLGQRQKEFLSNIGLNYDQLNAQQKLAYAQLGQNNDQFNKTLGYNYTGLENDANYKALLAALSGGK